MCLGWMDGLACRSESDRTRPSMLPSKVTDGERWDEQGKAERSVWVVSATECGEDWVG